MNGIEVFCFIVIVPLRAEVILNGFLFEQLRSWEGAGRKREIREGNTAPTLRRVLCFFSQVQSSEDDRASNKRTWMPGIDCQTVSVSTSRDAAMIRKG